jgi:leader peptidase (prepilin peptidase)/N-methyltransferase
VKEASSAGTRSTPRRRRSSTTAADALPGGGQALCECERRARRPRPRTAVTAVVAVVAGALGLVVGHLINRAAARFPWSPESTVERRPALRPPLVEGVTAVLFALAVLRFGLSWELPAFLFLAAAGVLLAVIDLRHHLLPNRVVGPSVGIGAVLLLVAALPDGNWDALLRAGLGAVTLFAGYLVLALISPRGLGMGDVKLAGLLGLHLGWIGWSAVFGGAIAGFAIQALLALALLAGRRIGLRGELPFGPAMLLGAAVAIGWNPALIG